MSSSVRCEQTLRLLYGYSEILISPINPKVEVRLHRFLSDLRALGSWFGCGLGLKGPGLGFRVSGADLQTQEHSRITLLRYYLALFHSRLLRGRLV